MSSTARLGALLQHLGTGLGSWWLRELSAAVKPHPLAQPHGGWLLARAAGRHKAAMLWGTLPTPRSQPASWHASRPTVVVHPQLSCRHTRGAADINGRQPTGSAAAMAQGTLHAVVVKPSALGAWAAGCQWAGGVHRPQELPPVWGHAQGVKGARQQLMAPHGMQAAGSAGANTKEAWNAGAAAVTTQAAGCQMLAAAVQTQESGRCRSSRRHHTRCRPPQRQLRTQNDSGRHCTCQRRTALLLQAVGAGMRRCAGYSSCSPAPPPSRSPSSPPSPSAAPSRPSCCWHPAAVCQGFQSACKGRPCCAAAASTCSQE